MKKFVFVSSGTRPAYVDSSARGYNLTQTASLFEGYHGHSDALFSIMPTPANVHFRQSICKT